MPEEGKDKPKDPEGVGAHPVPRKGETVHQPGIIFSALRSKISSEELLKQMNRQSKDS